PNYGWGWDSYGAVREAFRGLQRSRSRRGGARRRGGIADRRSPPADLERASGSALAAGRSEDVERVREDRDVRRDRRGWRKGIGDPHAKSGCGRGLPADSRQGRDRRPRRRRGARRIGASSVDGLAGTVPKGREPRYAFSLRMATTVTNGTPSRSSPSRAARASSLRASSSNTAVRSSAGTTSRRFGSWSSRKNVWPASAPADAKRKANSSCATSSIAKPASPTA